MRAGRRGGGRVGAGRGPAGRSGLTLLRGARGACGAFRGVPVAGAAVGEAIGQRDRTVPGGLDALGRRRPRGGPATPMFLTALIAAGRVGAVLLLRNVPADALTIWTRSVVGTLGGVGGGTGAGGVPGK